MLDVLAQVVPANGVGRSTSTAAEARKASGVYSSCKLSRSHGVSVRSFFTRRKISVAVKLHELSPILTSGEAHSTRNKYVTHQIPTHEGKPLFYALVGDRPHLAPYAQHQEDLIVVIHSVDNAPCDQGDSVTPRHVSQLLRLLGRGSLARDFTMCRALWRT